MITKSHGIYLFRAKNGNVRNNINNVWNQFKVNNKDTRTTSSLALVCYDSTNFAHWSGVHVVNIEHENTNGIY